MQVPYSRQVTPWLLAQKNLHFQHFLSVQVLKKQEIVVTYVDFNSQKFHFRRNFVYRQPVSRGENHKTMIGSVEDQILNGESKISKGDYKGVKAALSEFSTNNFCVADLEYTLNHVSKWLMMTLIGVILICKHDNEALWVASGSVINVALSFILKKILNQDRPVSTSRSDPGMPSTHAQTISFTVVFAIISLFQCRGVNIFTISLSGLTLAIGSYLSWLRVTQKFHTISQVGVGAILGTIISLLWLWSWVAIVHEAFISIWWVRATVGIGAVAFWLTFLMYIFRNLIVPEDQNK